MFAKYTLYTDMFYILVCSKKDSKIDTLNNIVHTLHIYIIKNITCTHAGKKLNSF